MKKTLKLAYLLLAAVFCFTACDEKNTDYEPGTPTEASDTKVYFSSDNSADFIEEPGIRDSIVLTLVRTNTQGDLSLPVTVNYAADGLNFPSTVEFKNGEDKADYVIKFNDSDLKVSQAYKFSLSLPEKYADHYTEGPGTASFSSYVMDAAWEQYTENTQFTWKVDGKTYTFDNSDFYRLGTTTRYKLPNFLGSGVDLVFSCKDTDTALQGMDNTYDFADGDYAGFILWNDEQQADASWVVGDKTVSELAIFNTYGSSVYSYVNFSKGKGQFCTYYTTYADGTYEYYNYINFTFSLKN